MELMTPLLWCNLEDVRQRRAITGIEDKQNGENRGW
jgi:hypothetical protein